MLGGACSSFITLPKPIPRTAACAHCGSLLPNPAGSRPCLAVLKPRVLPWWPAALVAPHAARFALEVVAAVVEAIGAERVGIRLSPFNPWTDCVDAQVWRLP